MNTPTNRDRRRRAERILTVYATSEDRMDELSIRGQAAIVMSDLLADLMHYAAAFSIDFQNCVDVAGMHFDAECSEEAAGSRS